MRIDAHQHFWNYDPSMTWIHERMISVRKNFTPQDLYPVLQQHQFDGCVLVQVNQHEEENNYMLNYAEQNPFIKGIVGWVDFCSKNVEASLERHARHDAMKGYRHILQAESDEQYMLRKEFIEGISLLEKFNFSYDILIQPHHLPYANTLVGKFPNQKFVVNHLAKPLISKQQFEPWRKEMCALAKHEHVFCKLSGMVTEANWQYWKENDITPYMEVILESFGASRIMYGSDWPVCLVAGSYQRVLALVEDYIRSLSESEKNAIMGDNAVKFYNLN